MIHTFHDVRFPTDLALGAVGGPQRRTEVITLGSGYEQRNTRWANSRRRYNVGYGIKTVDDLYRVLEFFEERRGRLSGFRFRDPFDWKSASPSSHVDPMDQLLGTGDGVALRFDLSKRYGSGETGYLRKISHPVADTLRVAVAGVEVPPVAFEFDPVTSQIAFANAWLPDNGSAVTAGFEFDVPVRFDTDEISINLAHFEAGDIPSIALVELLT
ncbi:MAG: DUF2460 domain-containing protein [Pseudomonadota bacterium]